MNTPTKSQETIDSEHLRLLAIFHCVVGGFTALTSSFGLIHFGIGLIAILNPGADSPPIWFGWLFMLIGGFVVLSGWVIGALTAYSGRCLQLRKRRTFSLVMAGLNCMSVPFGTALGVFTILVLSRPSVKALYQGDARWAPPQTFEPQSIDLATLDLEEEARWKDLEENANRGSEPDGSQRIKINEKQSQSVDSSDT